MPSGRLHQLCNLIFAADACSLPGSPTNPLRRLKAPFSVAAIPQAHRLEFATTGPFKDHADPVDERTHLRSKILAAWIHDRNGAPDRLQLRQDLHELAIFAILVGQRVFGIALGSTRISTTTTSCGTIR
jgi:hypothetical protein